MRCCLKSAGLLLAVLSLSLVNAPVRGEDSPKPDTKPGTSAPKVELTIAGWSQILERVAAHKGQIVVIDAWSTSCPPCMKEFPHFVALHKKLGDRGVRCLSLNCDYDGLPERTAESYRQETLAFLTRHKATTENFLCSDPHEQWLDRIRLGSLPAVFVYGRDGKLVRRFDTSTQKPGEKEFTYADVTKLVEQLSQTPASLPATSPKTPAR